MEFNRDKTIHSLATDKEWDIAIIGGGATGLGVAVDAASRGYKTLLLEKYDFAKSTSSKSTKLVHGGVRYLAQGDVKLVYSALKERGMIFQNAPHLSSIQSFVIPSYSTFKRLKFLIGLKLYDWMAGKYRIGKSTSLSKAEVINRIPQVKRKNLKGGIQYFDGQFDDSRLALNLAQTASGYGASILNYAEVSKINKDANGKVNGLSFIDCEDKKTYSIQAKVIVNAAGIFVDDILKLEEPNHKNLVRPSQGTHIVVDQKFLGGMDALMIPETSDGRVLFGVPWQGKVLLGTTDTPIHEHSIEPVPLDEEVDFIMTTANDYLENGPKKEDVQSVYAGLRPLAAPQHSNDDSTKEVSRDHKLISSPSGLVTITGGKWTTYRKMGEDTVDMAVKIGNLPKVECKTKNLKIHGFSQEKQKDHWKIYGSDANKILDLAEENPVYKEKIHPRFTHIMAEVVWACRYEMARKVEDVLSRRTRLLFLDAKAARDSAGKVAKIMANELNKDEEWIINEVKEFETLVQQYLI